jgi:hypothetical protein
LELGVQPNSKERNIFSPCGKVFFFKKKGGYYEHAQCNAHPPKTRLRRGGGCAGGHGYWPPSQGSPEYLAALAHRERQLREELGLPAKAPAAPAQGHPPYCPIKGVNGKGGVLRCPEGLEKARAPKLEGDPASAKLGEVKTQSPRKGRKGAAKGSEGSRPPNPLKGSFSPQDASPHVVPKALGDSFCPPLSEEERGLGGGEATSSGVRPTNPGGVAGHLGYGGTGGGRVASKAHLPVWAQWDLWRREVQEWRALGRDTPPSSPESDGAWWSNDQDKW